MMTWRKSSFSGGGTQSDCVELANTLCHLRDSKNAEGPTLRGNVAALVAAIKTGRFDR
jgi:hypothetical protein